MTTRDNSLRGPVTNISIRRPPRQFEDLAVFRGARALAKSVYALTSNRAVGSDRALSDQLRRSAISIVSNIAEGFERSGNRELIRFLAVAKGSCGELRAQLLLAADLYLTDAGACDELRAQAVILSRRLARFIEYLRVHPRTL